MIDRDQRRYWAEERVRRGLVSGGGQFAGRGLMDLLDEPRVLVATLTADPLHPAIDLRDDGLVAAVLPQAFTGQTANGVSVLPRVGRTAGAVARYSGKEDGRWRGFAAVRSDGGVEVGMGGVACWEYRSGSPLAGRLAFRLFVLVHAVRAAIAAQARLCQQVGDLAPFELTVGIHMPQGSILTAFAAGWAQPEHALEVDTALEMHPIIREEVEPWPVDAQDQEELLVRVGSRICSAFDVAEPRFLPWLGQGLGVLSEDYG
jgi:hypothetical protein